MTRGAAAVRRFLREEIRPYFRHPARKPLPRQAAEIWRLWRHWRFVPYHYIKAELYAADAAGDLLAYIPPKLVERVQEAENPSDHVALVRDKDRFAAVMQAAGLPCIATLALVEDGRVLDQEGRPLGRQGFLGLGPPHGGKLFLKDRSGAHGTQAGPVPVTEATWQALARRRRAILQPVVVQHPALARLFPQALNTIRIDTFWDGEAWVHDGAALRMGTGRMHVDNWAAGGIVVGVDLATGRLRPSGRRKTLHCERPHRAHPDTGTAFDGYPLPFWPEIRALVVAAAAATWPLRALCWDVAVTEDGPILVEANDYWSVNMMQTAWGPMGDTPIGRTARLRHGLPAPVNRPEAQPIRHGGGRNGSIILDSRSVS